MEYKTQEDLKSEGKPSFLIRDALEALEDAEKSKTITVRMSRFLAYEDGLCIACLGSIHRLKRMGLLDGTFDGILEQAKEHRIDSVEDALDSARLGMIGSMFAELDIEHIEGEEFNRDIDEYSHSPEKFKRQMNKLADDLDKAGW